MENFGKQSSVRPQSRTIHTAPVAKRRKFKFRWWMALILVAVIAIIGIVILRFSHASVIPPEEQQKIDAGIIIKKTLPCSVEYPPYGYKRTFSVQECIDALNPDGYAKLVAMVTTDLEAIYIKNHPTPTPAPTPTPTTNPVTTPTTPATTTNSTPEAPQSTISNMGDTTVNQSVNSDNTSTSSPIASDPDSQTVTKDLGTLSGFVKIDFTPQDPTSVTAIAVFVGNTNVGEDIHSPYKFGFDTSQFKNGDYKISTVVLHKDNSTTQQNYTAKIQNSSIDKFFYSLGAPWRFIFR